MRTTYHDFRCFDSGVSRTTERYTIFPPRSLAKKYFYSKNRKWSILVSSKFGYSFFDEAEYHPTAFGKKVDFHNLPKMVQNAVRRAFPEDEW